MQDLEYTRMLIEELRRVKDADAVSEKWKDDAVAEAKKVAFHRTNAI